MNMVYNMTKGNPIKMILAFSVPMLIGNIFQQVYNFVDAAVVGRFVSAEALAAVGATGTLMAIANCLMMGLTNGAGIIISQCLGARNYEELRKTVTGLVYIVILTSIITSTLGIIFARPILEFLNTPSTIIKDAVRYIDVIFLFLMGTAIYNAAGSVLRNLGDSRTPLYALILASIINVGLDLLFVIVFDLGVIGAAVATIISQIISAAYCVVHIIRYHEQLNLGGITARTSKTAIKKIFRTGLPAALESCLISLGAMSVQRLVNSCGDMTIAAYTAATKIDAIAIAPVVSVGTALSVYTGQNMGADDFDRIRKGLYQTLAALVCICAVLATVIVIFRTQLLGLFLDRRSAPIAIYIGGNYLKIVCFAYIVAAIMRTYMNVLRGAGDVNISALSGVMELAGRIIFAYILVRPLGATGIWLATPLAWATGATVPVIRYYSGKWKTKKLV